MANLFGKMTQAFEAMDRSVGEHYSTPAKEHIGEMSIPGNQGEMEGVNEAYVAAAPSQHQNLDELIRRSTESNREKERQQMERDHALLQLQRDYDASTAQHKAASRQLAQAQEDIETLNRQRGELRNQITELSDAKQKLESQLNVAQDRNDFLDRSNQVLHQDFENLKHDHSVVSSQVRSLEAQLKRANSEYMDHKNKSRILLLEKDSELERLRADSTSGGEHSDGRAASELESLRTKMSVLEQSRGEQEQSMRELMVSLEKARNDVTSVTAQLESNMSQLQEAKHNALVAQSMYDGEIASHQATRSRMEGIIRERDEEIRLLEKRSNHRSQNGTEASGSQEWERRAKDLADLVMEKQAVLETKRSECDQWRTRYEIAQQKVREMELVASSTTSVHGSGNHHVVNMMNSGSPLDSVEAQGDFARSRFFGQLSKRGKWGQQITGVASKLDAITLLGGSLLRRNSVMRVALLLYILTLHMWVFFVLAVSTAVPQGTGSKLAEPKL